MQRNLDDKDKVMEAFLHNPDLRNYGFFAQGNLNPYPYQKPEAQNMSKDQNMKGYAHNDMKSPLGFISQMSRSPEVGGSNLMQPNLNLMRTKPGETVHHHQAQNLALFESALRMRFGDPAFMQHHPQAFDPQHDDKMKAVTSHQQQPHHQQHSMTTAFRRTLASPTPALDEAGTRSGNHNQQNQSLAAYPQMEHQQSVSSPTQRGDYGCGNVFPERPTPRPIDVTRTVQSNVSATQSPHDAHAAMTSHGMQRRNNISPDTVVSFVHALHNLTSTEVGRACIPHDQFSDVMVAVKRNAGELIAQNDKGKVKIKSEFGGSNDPMDFENRQFVQHSDGKSKSGMTSSSLMSYDHDLRMKALEHHPMPLVTKQTKSSQEIVFPNNNLHSMAIDPNLFSAMSTKTPKKPKERPHICFVCNMAFSQKNHLQVHERKHTGEKPYRCTMCDAAFARKDGLVIHQRKHTGERPYKCTFCESAFTRKDKMVIHERTHTGEKPYQCHQCDSKYTRKDKLTLHLKKHALAARRELEKVLQSTSHVVNNLTLQSVVAAAGGHGSGDMRSSDAAVNLRIPDAASQAAANLQSASMASSGGGGGGGSVSSNAGGGNNGGLNSSADNLQLSLPTSVAVSNLHNSLPGGLNMTSAVASNVHNNLLGNLSFHNAMAANFNAVATNLTFNSGVMGGNSGDESAAGGINVQDSSNMQGGGHDTNPTNLSSGN